VDAQFLLRHTFRGGSVFHAVSTYQAAIRRGSPNAPGPAPHRVLEIDGISLEVPAQTLALVSR
jgi:hypothetical protein